jgi:hypothetical protein
MRVESESINTLKPADRISTSTMYLSAVPYHIALQSMYISIKKANRNIADYQPKNTRCLLQ